MDIDMKEEQMLENILKEFTDNYTHDKSLSYDGSYIKTIESVQNWPIFGEHRNVLENYIYNHAQIIGKYSLLDPNQIAKKDSLTRIGVGVLSGMMYGLYNFVENNNSSIIIPAMGIGLLIGGLYDTFKKSISQITKMKKEIKENYDVHLSVLKSVTEGHNNFIEMINDPKYSIPYNSF